MAHALSAAGVASRLLLTGQHPGLRASDHGLGGVPRDRLGCTGLDDPIEHAALVAASVAPVLRRDLPDLVVVQGDTSSALGGAEAAVELGLPLVHVEAGLRSFDREMPWPEEGNRIAIDAVADLLFAHSQGAAENLRREGVSGQVYVTGNTGIDALFATLAGLPEPRRRSRSRNGALDLLVTCHRRENWGAGLASLAAALIDLAGEGSARIEVVLHPNPRVAEDMHQLFTGVPGIALAMPTTHAGMVHRMRSADLILSDSGGVQEEAPALGIPLLVLRKRTERPEAIASGNARLVGTASNRILGEVRRLHGDRAALARMAVPALPFGNGTAAPKIAAHIRRWLLSQDRRPMVQRRA